MQVLAPWLGCPASPFTPRAVPLLAPHRRGKVSARAREDAEPVPASVLRALRPPAAGGVCLRVANAGTGTAPLVSVASRRPRRLLPPWSASDEPPGVSEPLHPRQGLVDARASWLLRRVMDGESVSPFMASRMAATAAACSASLLASSCCLALRRESACADIRSRLCLAVASSKATRAASILSAGNSTAFPRSSANVMPVSEWPSCSLAMVHSAASCSSWRSCGKASDQPCPLNSSSFAVFVIALSAVFLH